VKDSHQDIKGTCNVVSRWSPC